MDDREVQEVSDLVKSFGYRRMTAEEEGEPLGDGGVYAFCFVNRELVKVTVLVDTNWRLERLKRQKQT